MAIPGKSSSITGEIRKFLKLTTVSNGGIHKWWHHHRNVFNVLGQLARIVLAVLATSASSEQVFLTTSLILTAKRVGLGPENVRTFNIYMTTTMCSKTAMFHVLFFTLNIVVIIGE